MFSIKIDYAVKISALNLNLSYLTYVSIPKKGLSYLN